VLQQLLNFSLISENFYGFFIDLKKKSNMTTNGNKTNNFTGHPTFANELLEYMEINRTYFVAVANGQTIQTIREMTKSICIELKRPYWKGGRNSTANGTATTQGPVMVVTNATVSTLVTTSGQNVTTVQNLTTISTLTILTSISPNLTSISPNFTTVTPKSENVTGNSTKNKSMLNDAINALHNHPNTSMILGFLLVAVIIIFGLILCRKRIRNFVSRKLRAREADNETTSIRYGSLQNAEEYYDLDLLTRRPGGQQAETRW